MRKRSGWAAGAALMVLTAACAEQADSPLAPEFGASVAGPGASVYTLGTLMGAVPNPCRAAANDQFDFWVGEWDVLDTGGAAIATSVISEEMDDCLIMEDYIASGGFQGRSLNAYDASTGLWHQTFVDNVLASSFRLEGMGGPGTMLLAGEQDIFNINTGAFLQRAAEIEWTANPDGSVRQVITASFDGGPAAVTFDGLYVAADDLDRAAPTPFQICNNNAFFRTADFWLGDWSVAAQSGPHVGTSTVATDLNNCLIQEDFEGRNGYRSRSFLYFDFPEFVWYRTVADNLGNVVELSGSVDASGRLVMTGEDELPNGMTFLVRVTLDPQAGGVVQTWETSSDGGDTWKPSLSLVYEAL